MSSGRFSIETFERSRGARLVNRRRRFFAPAADVYAIEVSILQKIKPSPEEFKLSVAKPSFATKIKEISSYEAFAQQVLDEFYSEYENLKDGKNPERDPLFCRESIPSQIVDVFENLNTLEAPDTSLFIALLLRDCLAYKPQDRPSAAQVTEILQVFSSYREVWEVDKGTPGPNYDEIKRITVLKIPLVLRRHLFSPVKSLQLQVHKAICALVENDESYKNTLFFVMDQIILNKGCDITSLSPILIEQLQKCIYLYGDTCDEVQYIAVP